WSRATFARKHSRAPGYRSDRRFRLAAPLRVAGAHEAAGHRAGMVAPLEGRRPGQERGDVAFDPLHEAAAAGGKIVDELRLVEAQALEIDQGHAGAQPGREPPAVPRAEEIRRLAGLALDQQFERQSRPAPPIATPMQEHVGWHARIDDRGAVRAAVAQAKERRRVGQHLAYRL